MSIDSLTIVSPRVNPIQYTSLTEISLTGGVFGVDIDTIEITNLNHPSGGTYYATFSSVGGDEYDWQVDNVSVVSIGLNQFQVKAFDVTRNYMTEYVNIYVDYTQPHVSSVFPSGTGVAVNSSIRVNFSESMEDDIATKITISPSLSGTWTSNFNNTICSFEYTGELDATNSYEVTIDAGAKDAFADTDPNDVLGNTGNIINGTLTYNFTTGLGIGPHNPTRLGLTPPEEIKQVGGDTLDDINESFDKITSANFSTVNKEVFNNYLATGYSIRRMKVQGDIVDDIFNDKTSFSNTIKANPPIIIRPFRDKSVQGELVDNLIHSSNNVTINPYIQYGYLSTGFSLRHKDAEGFIFDIDNVQGVNHIPMILSYLFDDETSGGAVHKVSNNALSLTWANPQDIDNTRLYYQLELSKTAVFAHPLIFNTEVNREAFFTSDLGVNFEAIGQYGVRAGQGFTRFISPVELDGGIWYVRIQTGNKIIGE